MQNNFDFKMMLLIFQFLIF